METKKDNKPKKAAVKNVEKVDSKGVSQSTEAVDFVASKDHGKMIKGTVYSVSQNVAEILEARGLGKLK